MLYCIQAVEKQNEYSTNKAMCPPTLARTPLWENCKTISASEFHSVASKMCFVTHNKIWLDIDVMTDQLHCLSANKFLILNGKLVC